jgi:hypothetical protein
MELMEQLDLDDRDMNWVQVTMDLAQKSRNGRTGTGTNLVLQILRMYGPFAAIRNLSILQTEGGVIV